MTWRRRRAISAIFGNPTMVTTHWKKNIVGCRSTKVYRFFRLLLPLRLLRRWRRWRRRGLFVVLPWGFQRELLRCCEVNRQSSKQSQSSHEEPLSTRACFPPFFVTVRHTTLKSIKTSRFWSTILGNERLISERGRTVELVSSQHQTFCGRLRAYAKVLGIPGSKLFSFAGTILCAEGFLYQVQFVGFTRRFVSIVSLAQLIRVFLFVTCFAPLLLQRMMPSVTAHL